MNTSCDVAETRPRSANMTPTGIKRRQDTPRGVRMWPGCSQDKLETGQNVAKMKPGQASDKPTGVKTGPKYEASMRARWAKKKPKGGKMKLKDNDGEHDGDG